MSALTVVWLVFLFSLVWLPLCVRIGDLLQREWWMVVFVLSLAFMVANLAVALVATAVAVVT